MDFYINFFSKAVNCIWNNKEWLFSGVGVTTISIFCMFVFKKNNQQIKPFRLWNNSSNKIKKKKITLYGITFNCKLRYSDYHKKDVIDSVDIVCPSCKYPMDVEREPNYHLSVKMESVVLKCKNCKFNKYISESKIISNIFFDAEVFLTNKLEKELIAKKNRRWFSW